MRFIDWRGRHFGWLVTGAMFSQFFFGFGIMASYVMLYVELEKEFVTASASALGWVAAVAWGLSSMMSVVTSPLYEKFGHRKVIIFGVFATFIGIIGTTFATELWVMYITFGVILGGGFNFVFNPSLNLVTAYFPKMNCTRATSGATMGSPIGLLVLCPLLDIGFNTIGWRNSYRILGGIYLLFSIPMCTLMQPPNANYQKQLQGEPPTKAIPSVADDKAEEDAETGKLNPAKPDDSAALDKTETKVKFKEISTKDNVNWKKYYDILCLPQHWFYFFGVCGSTMCGIFNVINLASLLTHSGYKENNAAFMITAMTISELIIRFLITTFGDCLPCARLLLFPIVCVMAGISSVALGLSQDYAVVIAYVAVAGIARGVIFGLSYSVAVEVFGAEKSIEIYTSLLLAFGVGGLFGSFIPGLSFDLTGSYIVSLHICAGLWIACGILFAILYMSYRKSRIRNPYTVADTNEELETDAKHLRDPIRGYLSLVGEDIKTESTSDMRSWHRVTAELPNKENDSVSVKHLHDLNEGYVTLLSGDVKIVSSLNITNERAKRVENIEKVTVV